MKIKDKLRILKAARKKMKVLDNKRTHIYNRTIKRLGLRDNDMVFDYLFNGPSVGFKARDIVKDI